MLHINEALFGRTTHSPSLIDLVGYERAHEIVDFCFIANPYYPSTTPRARACGTCCMRPELHPYFADMPTHTALTARGRIGVW
jgi:hypothetical protein